MPDFIIPGNNGSYSSQGPVADRFAATGFNVNGLRTLDTLRKDEFLMLDEAVIKIAEERLIGVADLMGRGLTTNLSNGLGTTVFQWETQSGMTAAELNMDGVTAGEGDRVTYNLNSMPLPIIHKDFFITRRALEASRTRGEPLDVSNAEAAARQVAELAEDLLFNGASLTFGGGSLQGYRTATNRNTVTLTQNWDDSAKTGEEMLADVISMISAANADFMFGPYMLYVPGLYWTQLQEDFKANSDRTILERIRAVAGIIDVKPADALPPNNVLLVQMSTDVVKEVVGLQPTVVQWEAHGGMRINFKVMAIMVPRIASDANSRSGIVHLS